MSCLMLLIDPLRSRRIVTSTDCVAIVLLSVLLRVAFFVGAREELRGFADEVLLMAFYPSGMNGVDHLGQRAIEAHCGIPPRLVDIGDGDVVRREAHGDAACALACTSISVLAEQWGHLRALIDLIVGIDHNRPGRDRVVQETPDR